MKWMFGLLVLLAASAWSEAWVVRRAAGDENDEDEEVAAEQLENAKNNLNTNLMNAGVNNRLPRLRNANTCTSRDCMWPKSHDGRVYIPYLIADHYTPEELDIIKRGINSFSYSTCIRFYPRTVESEFLYIQSLEGCHSYVGRQRNIQMVSLSHHGCIYYGTVQHELLHALGFSHEQCRSDRDEHIQVLLKNVIEGEEYNFNKAKTLNQRTPYDYDSVMHYNRLAFSRDSRTPTMVAVPDPKIEFGMARQMSKKDIGRVNLLYCN